MQKKRSHGVDTVFLLNENVSLRQEKWVSPLALRQTSCGILGSPSLHSSHTDAMC